MDQDVINLAKAIRQTESGGDFNAKGKSGESGAYQWMPNTWKQQAKEVLGDENAPMSPENQNAVAYVSIKKMKDKGMNPAQIAATWNSGSPEGWENKVGTNQMGVKYDVPSYVKSVTDTYQQYKQGNQNPTIQPNSSSVGGYNPKPFSNPSSVNQFEFSTVETPQEAKPKEPLTLGSIGRGALDVLKAAEKPFIGAAAIPTQLLAKALGQEDPFKKGVAADLAKEPSQVSIPADVTDLSLEKKAGDIAQVGSYFVPGSGILGAAGMGALQGAGNRMSEGGNLTDVATGGALGAALGGGLAGAAKLGGMALQKAGGLISGAEARRAAQGIKDAYSSALNLTAAERGFEGRSGKDIAQVLLEKRVPLGRNENGTLDASEAIAKLQEALDPLNKQAEDILIRPQGVIKPVKLADVLASVKQRIAGSKVPATQAKRMQKEAELFLKDEAAKYGNEVPPHIADQIKQSFQNSVFKKAITPEGKLTNNVQYLISDELKGATERSVAGTDTDVSLKALNKQRSDLVDAITRLTKLDGVRLLKGGRLGNIAGGLTGTVIGSSVGGIPGGLLGDYFGTKAAEFLNNPATRLGIAEAKEKAAGFLPRMAGKAAKPVGSALEGIGTFSRKGARAAGLLGNLVQNGG